MVDIERTVVVVIVGPEYNLHGGYFFDILLTAKRIRLPDWTTVIMTEDVIEKYKQFKTNGFPFV